MLDSELEVRSGERFAFGDNWNAFLKVVDDERISVARRSLQEALGRPDLRGLSFLDIGCGSGLFSLAAYQLGATVHSFDFDRNSVAATAALRSRYAPDSPWLIETGSILDRDFVAGLGRYDIVYSWGVLHHTGDMWSAVAASGDLVRPGGQLFISIYNDQGRASRVWLRVKRRYNRSGRVGRALLVSLSALYLYWRLPVRMLVNLVRPGRLPGASGARGRGMSRRHDLVDWVGGYPFQVARPEEIFRFVHDRGFELRHLWTCGGNLGCNEYVFQRGPLPRPGSAAPPQVRGAGAGRPYGEEADS
ncbi:methyltransferase domain-containing protein [Micromonospora sp. NPDC049559]|uniref:class I SAM-dependent methyltransferase n=1 Tax=Micromonospora sp. NPDC049559 TaxID=3155923 RepID=UPI00342AB972